MIRNRVARQGLVVSVICLLLTACGSGKDESTQAAQKKMKVKLTDEVHSVLDKRITTLRKFFQDTTIIHAVNQSNIKNKSMSMKKIHALDAEWRNKNESDLSIKAYMTNSCARVLRNFQNKHNGYAEIFVTDRFGLNVCQTNKTTDYYQADEKWWTDTYAKGRGHPHYGEIEYDESSFSESIPIYIPIEAPESSKTIGVAKVIVDLHSLKEDLQ